MNSNIIQRRICSIVFVLFNNRMYIQIGRYDFLIYVHVWSAENHLRPDGSTILSHVPAQIRGGKT